MFIHPSHALSPNHWPDSNDIYTTKNGEQFIFEQIFIPVNRECGKYKKICWKSKDAVNDRTWSSQWGYSCKDCMQNYLKALGEPVFLETLDGKKSVCAKFLLGNAKANILEHNKIYTAQELGLTNWLKTQKNEKLPTKFKCIRGL